jgi:hypothetical protein
MHAPECRDKARGVLWSGNCGGVATRWRPAVKVNQTTRNGRGEECKRFDLELSNIKGARNAWEERIARSLSQQKCS